MSGNPMGLAEISHFGSMQRVGGKAAGFINKKFFHPSSLANQEKLWLAITKQDKLERDEKDAECRRDEERQVEALKKEMYQRGQAPNSGDSLFLSSASGIAEGLDGKQKREQRLAFEEQKKRKGILKQERLRVAEKDADPAETCHVGADVGADVGTEDGTGQPTSSSSSSAAVVRTAVPDPLAKSSYPEDVYKFGHESVWGSWFSTDVKRWGYRCCELLESKRRCPHAPEEPLPPAREKAERGDRGSKRRRGSGGQGGRPKAAEDRARAEAKKRTLYIPQFDKQGDRIFSATDAGKFVVDASNGGGVAFRNSKNLDDRHEEMGVQWGAVVQGDLQDGWLRVFGNDQEHKSVRAGVDSDAEDASVVGAADSTTAAHSAGVALVEEACLARGIAGSDTSQATIAINTVASDAGQTPVCG